MPIEAADWYDPNPDLTQLLQGDVLDGIPVVFGPSKAKRWILLRPTPQGSPIEQAESGLPKTFRADVAEKFASAWEKQEELVLARASVARIIIISQSCDIEWRNHVLVAPVNAAAGISEEQLTQLRQNNIAHLFYLPSDPDMPESSCDLSRITAVHASYFRPDFFVRRLTALARIELQKSLTDFLGRPFGFNILDKVPQTTDYACMRCFLTRGEIVVRKWQADKNFDPCPMCGTDALWIKVNEVAK